MKKLVLLLALVLPLALVAQAQFGKYFKNRTLRIDYFHSGNVEDEYFMTDELVLEGKWAGTRQNLTDPFDYGEHRIMVYDSATDQLVYTKGFSSLFAEYQATEEAKSQCGNFSESFLMPLPKKPVRIVFQSRDKQQVWHVVHEEVIDPAKASIRQEKPGTCAVEMIHKGGNPKKNVDIVFLPEGYTSGDMDKFLSDCSRFSGYLLETSPYDEYRGKINIRAVMAPSEEAGTDKPQDKIERSTLLNSSFGTFGTDRYLTTSDNKSMRKVASGVPYDAIVILVNDTLYGGGGVYNYMAISTVDDRNSGFVFTHEFGHSFAGLGDEYSASDDATENIYALDKEPWEPNITTLVHFEDKWLDLMDPSVPMPTPATDEYLGKVGVFEGAGYQAKGIYRPFIDCSMNVIKFNNYCPVCRRSIREKIESCLK